MLFTPVTSSAVPGTVLCALGTNLDDTFGTNDLFGLVQCLNAIKHFIITNLGIQSDASAVVRPLAP